MATGGTGKQRTDCLNGLAVATDDPANIALAHLQPKNGHLPAWYFREHDLVGKLDELTNDELEELFHGNQKVTPAVKLSIRDCGWQALSPTTNKQRPTIPRPLLAWPPLPLARLALQRTPLPLVPLPALSERSPAALALLLTSKTHAAACLLFFLIKLRTVSEGCAPREIQCSTRSRFQPAVVIGFLRIVMSNDLNEFAVARTAFVRNHDLVVGTILRAFSA